MEPESCGVLGLFSSRTACRPTRYLEDLTRGFGVVVETAWIYHSRPHDGGDHVLENGTKETTPAGKTVPHPSRLKVLVVDDHPLIRQGLKSLLDQTPDLELCAQASHPRAALQQIEQVAPDVALVDLSLAGGSGLELIRQLRRARPTLPILVLSMLDQEVYAPRALHAGANGYIMKSAESSELIDAIRTIGAGQDSWPVAVPPLRPLEAREVTGLTDREFEVFELVAQGLATRSIAAALGVSTKTVETHRHRIKEKLGFRSGPELVHYAIVWRETNLLRAP